MNEEVDIFGLVMMLIGVCLSFIIPILIHLYPRLPLVPSAKKWEKLPDELQVGLIKKIRKLAMFIYFVGGLVFIAIGIVLQKSHFSDQGKIEDTKKGIKYMGEVQEVEAAKGNQAIPTPKWMKNMSDYFGTPPEELEARKNKSQQ